MEILKQARDLVTNSTHSSSLKEALLYLAKKEIQKRSAYKMRAISQDNNQKVNSSLSATSTSEAELSSSQYRKTLLKPGAACEYINPKTKQKCGCTQFLNVDHIQPKWAGGKNNLENLRVLCSSHNKHRYQIQASLK